jgi:hypothetical protein
MDPDTQRQLDEIQVLAKDNNRMLHAIRRDQWFGFVGRLIFWAIVLALPFYLYQQYLQPIIGKVTEATGIKTSGVLGLPTSAEVQKLINSFTVGK